MAKPFSVAKQVSYNPFKDEFSTPIQKMQKVFTPHQQTLLTRPDVTKSLIIAAQKCFHFKQDITMLVTKWVGQETSKFIKSIPLITTKE